MTEPRAIRIGTRGSPLARLQAEWVADRLREVGNSVELVFIRTRGDETRQGPIGEIGAQGVFTKEIQTAVLDGRVDLAVHSLKDLPTERVAGLCLAAVPPRESSGDALIARSGLTWATLPHGAIVGTGSLRRKASLLHVRPDLDVRDVRGNVETRLRKLADEDFDALVLAEAGLLRLGLADSIAEVLPHSLMLPAVGQGALGIEARADDCDLLDRLAAIDDPATRQSVTAERAMLAALRGGCLAPIGAWGRATEGGGIALDGAVLSPDGRHKLTAYATGPNANAAALGERVANDLLGQGAADLIRAGRIRNDRI